MDSVNQFKSFHSGIVCAFPLCSVLSRLVQTVGVSRLEDFSTLLARKPGRLNVHGLHMVFDMARIGRRFAANVTDPGAIDPVHVGQDNLV